MLEQNRTPHWESVLQMWCDAPENKAEATRTFQLLNAVIQKATLDSAAFEELTQGLEEIPLTTHKKQN